MNYLFDTNILLAYIRKDKLAEEIDRSYQALATPNRQILSVVSVGEIEAISLKNRWGNTRNQRLSELLNLFLVSDIHVDSIIQRYAEIDAYSQCRHPSIPSNFSARNMGKNDLWIAATASILGATLLTTDKDFAHLENTFLDIVILER